MVANIGRRVTIKDLAAACEVSTATISRVLNGIPGGYSAETEARIRKCAEDMGYVPNQMARSLITQKTNLIALLVPDIHYYFFQDFFSGLENYMNQKGYRILLCNTQEDSKLEETFVRELSNGLVDGMIISTLNSAEGDEYINELRKNKFPVILLERYGETLKKHVRVQVDNYQCGKIAVDNLYDCGHRRIAVIKGSDSAHNARIRYQGYLDGLKEHGIPFDPALVGSGNYSFQSGVKAMEELLDRKVDFTAVIPCNDLMTIGACKMLTKRGMRIPDDISVLGLDRTILTSTHEPPITAVDFGAEEMGRYTGENMIKLIAGDLITEITYVQKPKLILGRSVQEVI